MLGIAAHTSYSEASILPVVIGGEADNHGLKWKNRCRHCCRDNDGGCQQLQCNMALVVADDARYHQLYSPMIFQVQDRRVRNNNEVSKRKKNRD